MQTPGKARFIVPVLLALFCLLPIVTLFHHDSLAGWRMNRTLMAEPDEPSYVLMAKSLASGHGLSTVAITGRDTFYPPGLPIVLAAWGKIFGFSLESLHVCIALTLSAAILLLYFLLRRIFVLWNHPHAQRPAIIITALFATSWHALENALYILSEPLFMAALFAWLLVALKTDRWWMRPRAAAIVALLACAAWLVRSAGVVCLAATILYIVIGIIRHRKNAAPADTKARVLSLVSAGAVIVAIMLAAKLLTSSAPNSYSQQFFSRLGVDTFRGVWNHLGNFASVLVPEPWDWDQQQMDCFTIVGPILLIPCIAGVICRITRRGYAPTRFVEIFFALYMFLFLLWPFDFTRFWIPLLPLALAYAAYFIRHARPQLKLALPALALVLNIEQAVRLFPARQERLAYVSDCLAESAAVIRRKSPDPQRTIVCADFEDFFTFSWYLNPALDDAGYRVSSPIGRQRIESVISQQLDKSSPQSPRIFVVSYFKHDPRQRGEPTLLLVLQNLQKENPAAFAQSDPNLLGFHPTQQVLPLQWRIAKIQQRWNVTAVWELARSPLENRVFAAEDAK